ncbi:MAG: CYTH domain-containing protein [Candidatus Paceibacterota bacterium]|jgi:adenylate cyclase class IV
MDIEIEAKFLGIDTEKLRDLLKKNGAALVHSECLMKRNNFDYPDARLEKIGGWVRVRDEGDKITLSYKQAGGENYQGDERNFAGRRRFQ